MSGRARNYLFTVFADPGEDMLRLLDTTSWPEWVTFVVYQRELCPDTDREHFQGYLELSSPKTYINIHTDVPGLETAHLEVRRGTQQQAIAYCEKEDSRIEGPWRQGEPKAQGAREDLKRVRDLIEQNKPMREVAHEHPDVFFKYSTGLMRYRRMVATPRTWPMEIVIIVGPTRTGKSRKAHEMAPGAYWKDRGQWWDDYDGQHTVVWDEFYGSHCPFSTLLRILDRYPLSVECKGSSIVFASKRIIFTSNQEPCDWYDNERTHQMSWAENPLNARIQEFGTIIRTGLVHRVAPKARVTTMFRREFLYGENEMNVN